MHNCFRQLRWLLLWLACGAASLVGLGDSAAAAEITADSLLQQARGVLATIDGRLTAAGLQEPVEVLRDPWGVPHISARNQHDLFFAQGFVAAQDRLFQIDLWRRTACGQTAEVTGPEGLDRDRFARLIRYRGDMQAEWESYGPDVRAIVTAFTEGINACIDQLGERLPVEFQILGFRPGKWRPEDCLNRTSVLGVVYNLEQEVARAELIARVGPEAAQRLMPADPPVAAVVPEGLDLSGITSDVLAGFMAVRSAPRFALQPDRPQTSATVRPAAAPPPEASNNWAVSGRLSASGKPLLAGDPHRAITLPALRYMVHLQAPGWSVIGAGEPGLPGVALGHNQRIAWAITVVTTDQADLVVEETRPDDPRQYRVGDGWRPMEVVREPLQVRGRGPVELELCYTRHGPVIHEDRARRRAFVLRWVGSEPGTAAYLASLAVDRCGDWPQFLQAAARWKTPALNLTYADVEGNIGWIAAGLTPVRHGWHGLLPVPGASGTFAWQGFLPVDQYPQQLNPSRQFLVTANHNILPAGYTREISYEWVPPFRYQRLLECLSAKPRLDLDDFEHMQYDDLSIPARRAAALLVRSGAAPPELAPYCQLLAGFDGHMSRDSAAAALCGCWLPKLAEAFYAPHVPPHLITRAYDRGGAVAMLAALESPTAEWFGPDPAARRDALLRDSFAAAVSELRQRLGDDPQPWQWGRLQTVAFRHPLAGLGPVYAQAFSRGPYAKGSERFAPDQSVYNARYEAEHGATYRQVFDLADWDRARANAAPGQSGQPGSPYYDNLLPAWNRGEYFPLYWSRAVVEKEAAHRLELVPAAGDGGQRASRSRSP